MRGWILESLQIKNQLRTGVKSLLTCRNFCEKSAIYYRDSHIKILKIQKLNLRLIFEKKKKKCKCYIA